MASSSTGLLAASSSPVNPWKYDVFLSFRGEDTRKSFTDHLHAALRRYGIITFIDDQLRRGKQISPALLQAIEESRFSIIIFSHNYASSTWCLDELTKILECVKVGRHTAFPVFYNVDPAHVRSQRESYAAAFERHEETYKDNMEKVIKWREALTEASKISGWDSRESPESNIVEAIAIQIFKEVNVQFFSNLKPLVGMESRREKVLSLLSIRSEDVRMIGIWGMPGIGKTTIAKFVYQQIHTQFEGSCFISSVRKKSLDHVKKELLASIVGESNLSIEYCIQKLCRSKKVLIVLDDVDHHNQLEDLIGNHNWFGHGSRIIVTTRDEGLLKKKNMTRYAVQELNKNEAFRLFCHHAFKDELSTEDFVEFKELSYRALDYTKGVPLALEILGSFLCKRSKKEWDSELKKLKRIPNEEVQEVFRISFDGLRDNEKYIFLDIACFFKSEDRGFVSEILESFDFYPEIGISILVEKALITISENNKLCMHDLIQEMGWEIIRKQSIEDLGKRSRLWTYEDVWEVLATNTGTKAIQGIALDLSTSEELGFNVDVFAKMSKLRLLRFRVPLEAGSWQYFSREGYKLHLTGDFKFLSNNLRYLFWHKYPLKSLPSNFYPMKLFELNMSFSQLEQLWEGNKAFPQLRFIDVSHSEDLIRTPDLSKAPEVRGINLEGCTSLVEVHPSIGTLKKLSSLILNGCSKLEKLPENIGNLTSLQTLDLSNCWELKKLPYDMGISFKALILSGCSKLEELPERIGKLTSLQTLNLSGCSKMKKLPIDMGTSLKTLNLSCCSKLEELPERIGKLMSLKVLNLSGCSKLKKLTIDMGTSLETLDLSGCLKLKKLPDEMGSLQCLECLEAVGSGIQEMPPSTHLLTKLKILNLSGCSKLKKLPDNMGSLQFLERLVLDGSGIQELPPSIYLLTRLKVLSLAGCKGKECTSSDLALSLSSSSPRQGLRLPSLLGLTCLKELILSDCNLQEGALPSDLSSLSSLQGLDLSWNNFITLPSLTQLTQLFWLNLESCKSLQSLIDLPSSISRIHAKNCESLETFVRPPNSYPRFWERGMLLDFFNCGRLQEVEQNASVEAILQGVSFASLLENGPYKKYSAIVPGSRVPGWFIHQSMGNSITVKLPPDFDDTRPVGLAFCVVLRESFGAPLDSSENDHILFGFSSLKGGMLMKPWSPTTHDHGFFKFSFMRKLFFGNQAAAKKCGIRLVYEPNREMMKMRQRWDKEMMNGWIIEHDTVAASSCPPQMVLFEGELCCRRVLQFINNRYRVDIEVTITRPQMHNPQV